MTSLEKMTKNSLLTHMNDDPCVICGTSGHNVWGACTALNRPAGAGSPLAKIYANPNGARRAMVLYRENEKPLQAEKQRTPNEIAQDEVNRVADAAAMAKAEADINAREKAAEEKSMNDSMADDSSSIAGLESVHDTTLAEPVETIASTPTDFPNNSQLGKGIDFGSIQQISKAKTSQFPLRKKFAKPHNVSFNNEVFTNHFDVTFKAGTTFFVYEIMGLPAGKSKRKSKYIYKTAIGGWDFLKKNKTSYVTDDDKTIVAWKSVHDSLKHNLIHNGDSEMIGAIWKPSAIVDGGHRLQLFIKLQRKLDLTGLQAHINTRQDNSNPDFNFNPVVAALNIAFASSLNTNVVQQSNNRFFVKSGASNLTGRAGLKTLCTMRGYHYTLKPAMGKVTLNVHTATSAFFRNITLDEYLGDNTFPLDERVSLLKTLRVYIVHDRRRTDGKEQKSIDYLNKDQKRIKTVFGIGEMNFEHPKMTFRKTLKNDEGHCVQDKKITRVSDHLKAVFGKSFNTKLPAINVGTKEDPVYYPREYLRILPYQMYKRLLPDNLVDEMLAHAAPSPARSRQLIEAEGMQSLGLQPGENPQALSACSPLLVIPTMLKIKGIKMKPLEIMYGTGSSPQPGPNAQWNLAGIKGFLKSPGEKLKFNYLLLVESNMTDETNTISTYATGFNKLLNQYHVCNGATKVATTRIEGIRHASFADFRATIRNTLVRMLEGNVSPRPNLVILLLKSRSIPAYSAFKDILDRDQTLSMQSLCLTQAPNFRHGRCKDDIAQYMANIMMKANLKFGGGNHTVQFQGDSSSRLNTSLAGTMVLGADLTHPSPNSLIGCPSIAALVGSIDSHVSRFRASMRLQQTCRQEIIDDLESMVTERIAAYHEETRQYPKNILLYRDGVSTGQYSKVRDEEIPQIKAACEKAGIKVKVTVLVAVKRHHTRFYPAPNAPKHQNGNCVPGTLIDRGVTSPHYSDFYLQSHHALHGTANPTHYFVIANEMALDDIQLQELTYKMCYTYARATIGVSYAPPAYYADRLCERGRSYLRDYFSPEVGSPHHTAYLNTKTQIASQHAGDLAATLAAISSLPTLPGRNAPRKSGAQIQAERAHQNLVDDLVERQVRNEAALAFARHRHDGPGPWSAQLDHSMFWM